VRVEQPAVYGGESWYVVSFGHWGVLLERGYGATLAVVVSPVDQVRVFWT